MRRIDFNSGSDMAEDFYAALEFSPGNNAEVDVMCDSTEPYSVVVTSDLDTLTADRDALAARLATAEKERDFARQYRCPDCHWHDGGSVSPCVRHNGCEHGMPGEYDDTWEHWRKRALAAEKERDEARRQLGEVTRELEGARAGKHASAWVVWHRVNDLDVWGRFDIARNCVATASDNGWDAGGFYSGKHVGIPHAPIGADAAKAAADAHLVAAGWYLEGGPFTPAPQHPASGGEDPGKMETP